VKAVWFIAKDALLVVESHAAEGSMHGIAPCRIL